MLCVKQVLLKKLLPDNWIWRIYKKLDMYLLSWLQYCMNLWTKHANGNGYIRIKEQMKIIVF